MDIQTKQVQKEGSRRRRDPSFCITSNLKLDYQPNIQENIKGATIVASLSTMNLGV